MEIQPDVNALVIAPILSSIETTLTKMLNTELERGQMYVLNIPLISMGVGAVIDIKGDYNGKVLLDMNTEAAMKISEIFLKEKIEEFDDLVISTVGEMLNVIAGDFSTKLDESKLKISVPQIITKHSKITDKTERNIMIIPLGFDKYIMNISFYIL